MKPHRLRALALLLLLPTLAHADFAPQRMGSEPLDPAREARAQALGKYLRCPVCQGVSIADSPASMARAQMDKVRDLIREGKTDEEIRQYFVARYGEWALLEPTAQGINLFVWIGPLLVLLIGLGVVALQFRRRTPVQPAREKSAAQSAAAGEDEDPFLRQVRAEVER